MNQIKRLRALIPEPRIDRATVIAIDGESVVVEFVGGGIARVIGAAAIGDKVTVRAGAIVGPAPALPMVVQEV